MIPRTVGKRWLVSPLKHVLKPVSTECESKVQLRFGYFRVFFRSPKLAGIGRGTKKEFLIFCCFLSLIFNRTFPSYVSFFQGQCLIWKPSNHSQINNDGHAILPSLYKLFSVRPSVSLNKAKTTGWQEKMGEDWGESGLKWPWQNPQGSLPRLFFSPSVFSFLGSFLIWSSWPTESLKDTLLKAFFKALKLASNIKPVYTKCYDHCIHYILASFLQISAKYNKWVNLQFLLVNRVGCDSDTLLCVTLTLYFVWLWHFTLSRKTIMKVKVG